ncbi:hypothetical protein GCM10010218_05280 [Streptomyces mashuensis]|uniref:Uncharacterized protein n=1 Tax=Streptomyces mashuensis TaxID=33904 RepID=A0A919AUF6_9ACTN|nr:hypothetical protein [Streptomyces mashuensis]GHF27283.1 hypothetical protein GCM10010218_05280 [Streptomyces mashuensis]
MAVRTHWAIDHTCGHQVERDLSDRAADRRAGFARWLGDRECSDCWKAARESSPVDKQQWLATRRAEEHAAATEWEQRYHMPPLEGPEKALAWAIRCRHQLVADAYTALVVEGDWDEADWSELEEQVRTVTRAGWWIDQRDAEGGDLPELLAAATDADRPTENPFV